MTISRYSRTAAPSARLLSLGAVLGPVLFTATWLALGMVSTGYTLFGHTFTSYSPVAQPISGLGMGSTAPSMNAAFVGTGLILIVGVIGVFRTLPPGRAGLRRWSLALLACTGLGQIVCGIFTLEDMVAHSLGFLLAAGVPIVAFLVAGRYFRQLPGWRRFGTWLRLGSPVTLVLFAAFFATFDATAEGAEHGVAGLVQRLLVLQVLGWFVAMGVIAARPTPGD